MRARSIKPGFYKNDELAACSPMARLLAPGLWMMADREGRLEYRPLRIKAEIFPYDNVDIVALLDELLATKHASTFYHGGKRFIQIEKFAEHQRPHANEVPSEIVSPNQADGVTCDQGSKCLLPRQQALRSESITGIHNLNPESPLAAAVPPGGDFALAAPEPPHEVPTLDPVASTVAEVAGRMKARHPALRSCGITEISRLLARIANRAKPKARVELLERIDRNHAGWCASEGWTRDRGEYAKGLANWLSPTHERYFEAPPVASAAPDPDDPYEQMLSQQKLYEADNAARRKMLEEEFGGTAA